MEPAEYDTLARVEDQHWWYLGMRAAAEALLRPAVPPGAGLNILDAGCGTGGGLRWLAAYGAVTGVDLHPCALAHASRTSRRVAGASVQALPFAAAAFDLVTSFDVLYHLQVNDDEAALREMGRVLRPGGWLLLRLPAHNWLRGAHDAQVHTRHRYTRAEVRQKLERTAFASRRLSYAGLLLLPAAAARRARQQRNAPHSDVELPAPALNRLLLAYLRAEARWLARADLPLGLSVLALAQRAG